MALPPEERGRGPWRQLGVVLGMGVTFAAAVAVGGLLGAWLDGKLGTAPWLTLGMLALGFVAGLLELFRELRGLDGDKQ